MHRLIAVLLLFPASALAYGEVVDDRPSPEERALHFFTDQLRVAPDATDLTFSTYPPVRPLIYSTELNEAARWYAEDMAVNGCFPADHSSCDGTSFGDRVRSFYSGAAIGENILAGRSSPQASVFEGWLYSDGHRENMLSDGWLELGTGHASEGHHWVQDFGDRNGVQEPIATSGTHWPLVGSGGGETEFFLAVHDPDGPVDTVDAYVDGVRTIMEVDRGSDGSRTFRAEVANDGDACREYFFEVTRGDGDVVRYPTAGVLLATVGGVSCDWWVPTAADPVDAEGLGSGGVGCNEGGPTEGAGSNRADGNVQLGRCSLGGRSTRLASLALCLLVLGLRRRP
jgi:hypothetical protein